MTDARNVYLIIFVMLLLPIVFYMLRRRFRTKDAKKRLRCLIYLGVMAIVAGAVCFGLYSHTIKTEPLLVAERAAQALYQADADGQQAQPVLIEQGLLAPDGTITGHEQGQWAQFAGAVLNMPDKNIELEGSKYYPIVMEKDGVRLLAAMKIQEDERHTQIQDIRLLWPEQIGDTLDNVTFFQSGKLPE